MVVGHNEVRVPIMGDRADDSHLAPERTPDGIEPTEPAPMGFRHLARFVGSIGRFVRLAERQGTRLVDVIDRWADIAEEHNRIAERGVIATERLADAIGGTGYNEPDTPKTGVEPEDTNGK
jgi:hypothetical protein